MTYNPDFKVTIIQRQMVQRRAILTTADQQKVVYDLSYGAIFNDLERPYRRFKVTTFFNAEYVRNGTRYIVLMEY